MPGRIDTSREYLLYISYSRKMGEFLHTRVLYTLLLTTSPTSTASADHQKTQKRTLATGSGKDEVQAIRQVAIDFQPVQMNQTSCY